MLAISRCARPIDIRSGGSVAAILSNNGDCVRLTFSVRCCVACHRSDNVDSLAVTAVMVTTGTQPYRAFGRYRQPTALRCAAIDGMVHSIRVCCDLTIARCVHVHVATCTVRFGTTYGTVRYYALHVRGSNNATSPMIYRLRRVVGWSDQSDGAPSFQSVSR